MRKIEIQQKHRISAFKRAKNGVGNRWQLERTPENLGIKEDKQMSIKLAMNRFWVVSKSLKCAVTFILLTRHHTTVWLRVQGFESSVNKDVL